MKPKVVCLCGSTKFKADFEAANRAETLAGNVVLSVGMFGHFEGLDPSGDVKRRLDELHLRKIDMADEVFVVNTGGYIGESTGREIEYARRAGKPVRYLCQPEPSVVPLSPRKVDWVADLEALHKKFGNLPAIVAAWPENVRREFWEFRLDFLGEELAETENAETPAAAVDGFIDLCVVAIGTLHAFGVDAREAWRRVHVANMAKTPGANPNRPNPFGLPDLVKPAGWVGPDHSDNVGCIPAGGK